MGPRLRARARGNLQGGGPAGDPDLIIWTLASREGAVAALCEMAEQGQATMLVNGERSHFARFLTPVMVPGPAEGPQVGHSRRELEGRCVAPRL